MHASGSGGYYRGKLNLDINDYLTDMVDIFGDKVYRTLVPRNVRLAEAPSYGVPAVLWDATSKGAQAYLALASEILGAAA